MRIERGVADSQIVAEVVMGRLCQDLNCGADDSNQQAVAGHLVAVFYATKSYVGAQKKKIDFKTDKLSN